MDELLDQAGRETNTEKRKALYAEFQAMVAEELPVDWTHTLPYHTIFNKNLDNPPLTVWSTSSPLDELYWK